MASDILDRELKTGDFVAFYSNIYRVTNVLESHNAGHGYAYIKIINGGETARPVKKYGRDMCLIPAEDVTAWSIKTGKQL